MGKNNKDLSINNKKLQYITKTNIMKDWREDLPTDIQISAIRNMGNGFNIYYDDEVKTKGEASDEIERLELEIHYLKENRRFFLGAFHFDSY